MIRGCPVCEAPIEMEPGAIFSQCRCHNCGWHGQVRSCVDIEETADDDFISEEMREVFVRQQRRPL